MPEVGDYILSHVGFSREEKPILTLQQGHALIEFAPLEQLITLRFDMTTRFCTGWYDMRAHESHVCPDGNVVNEKYDECAACQSRTGFNPAFYNASSVSTQQEERNLEPHMLYLAHFGKGIVKVGISHAARERSRLLEQGARSALVLDTFPTAHIARQYEAQIAALPGIAETLQVRKKIATLTQPYDFTAATKELSETRSRIEVTLGKTFSSHDAQTFDQVYFPNGTPSLHDAIEVTEQHVLSGNTVGMLGSLLFCTQQDTPLFIPIKKYTGYKFVLSYNETPIELPARQMTLF
jgi:hypothetical protein